MKDKNKKNKKKGKGLIMALIALLVIGLIGVIGYLVLNSFNIDINFGSIFGFTAKETNDYYEYIKKYDDDKYFLDNNSITLTTYKLEGVEKKVVTCSYQGKDGKNRTNIYYFKDDKVVEKIYDHETELRPLFNVDKEEYGFWLIERTNGNIVYTLLDDIVKESDKPTKYTFKQKDEYSSEDSSGKITRIVPSKEHFIEYSYAASYERVNQDNREKLKKILNGILNETMGINDTYSKYDEDKVQENLIELRKQQQQVKSYRETIKVGSHTLKLGTYKGTTTNMMGKKVTVKVVLKKNKINIDGKDESYYIKGKFIMVHNFEMFQIDKNNEMVYLAGLCPTLKYQG